MAICAPTEWKITRLSAGPAYKRTMSGKPPIDDSLADLRRTARALRPRPKSPIERVELHIHLLSAGLCILALAGFVWLTISLDGSFWLWPLRIFAGLCALTLAIYLLALAPFNRTALWERRIGRYRELGKAWSRRRMPWYRRHSIQFHQFSVHLAPDKGRIHLYLLRHTRRANFPLWPNFHVDTVRDELIESSSIDQLRLRRAKFEEEAARMHEAQRHAWRRSQMLDADQLAELQRTLRILEDSENGQRHKPRRQVRSSSPDDLLFG
jgi:hypothetical protein